MTRCYFCGEADAELFEGGPIATCEDCVEIARTIVQLPDDETLGRIFGVADARNREERNAEGRANVPARRPAAGVMARPDIPSPAAMALHDIDTRIANVERDLKAHRRRRIARRRTTGHACGALGAVATVMLGALTLGSFAVTVLPMILLGGFAALSLTASGILLEERR